MGFSAVASAGGTTDWRDGRKELRKEFAKAGSERRGSIAKRLLMIARTGRTVVRELVSGAMADAIACAKVIAVMLVPVITDRKMICLN